MRVVFRMIEIINVINVRADFRREELGVERHFFGARVAIQPVKSANANGSSGGVFAAPDFPFSAACGGPIEAII